MSPQKTFTLLALLCLFSLQGFCQSTDEEQLGLPGDNLNLYAVMKVFQESPTLEDFEKSLNDESQKINNLDLNEDGKIDYITVEDSVVNAVHNIVLKVAVNNNEEQNVAVIAVEKESDGKVIIQMVGDEDLYGKDYIVEPDDTATSSTPNPGYTGDANSAASTTAVQPGSGSNTVAAVNNWPVISYIFVPTYVSWYSPWHWGYYPTYWRPWKSYYWHYYYGYHYHWNYFYFSHYRRWPSYRIPGWQNIYYNAGFRRRSVLVQTSINRGNYRQTYARPALAKEGSAAFRKDNPKAPPAANVKLPSFDDKGRPVKKPLDPVGATRPAITQPVTRPVTKPVTRPVIDPVTRPVTRPITKPVQPVTRPVTRPVTKPVTPVTRPVTKPVTRPVQPVTRPITKPVQPSTRPVIKQR